MEIIIQPDSATACTLTARRVAQLIQAKPTAVLGLATGRTPLLLYQELIRMHREEGLSFDQVTTFNLDEYLGLAPEHPASYHHFMREHFFQHIDLHPARAFIPSGTVLIGEIEAYCARYEEGIKQVGGIDLQILGLGSDGHIGFNEPSSSLTSRTRIKTLTPRTRQDNARFFRDPEQVPHHVLTMGIGTIMESREIHLLAFGEKKAPAVAQTCEGPLTASVPASILQLHPRAKILLDEAAAAQLQRADYYRWVFANKPVSPLVRR